jgi:hypothetical protein
MLDLCNRASTILTYIHQTSSFNLFLWISEPSGRYNHPNRSWHKSGLISDSTESFMLPESPAKACQAQPPISKPIPCISPLPTVLSRLRYKQTFNGSCRVKNFSVVIVFRRYDVVTTLGARVKIAKRRWGWRWGCCVEEHCYGEGITIRIVSNSRDLYVVTW